MKTWVLIFCLFAVPASAQQSLVSAVKDDLIRRGVDISGPCGAFGITKRVAWALRGQGIGLVSKPQGTNCDGFSVDNVSTGMTGRSIDILVDAGGQNGPAWNDIGQTGGDWAPAIDPGDVPAPPPTQPPPSNPVPPTVIDLSGIYQRIEWTDQNGERRYLDLRAAQTMLSTQLQQIDARLVKMDNEPAWLMKVLSNRYVQMALSGIGAYIGAKLQ